MHITHYQCNSGNLSWVKLTLFGFAVYYNHNRDLYVCVRILILNQCMFINFSNCDITIIIIIGIVQYGLRHPT